MHRKFCILKTKKRLGYFPSVSLRLILANVLAKNHFAVKILPLFQELKSLETLYFTASSTATAQATVAPTIGLLPIPMSPIIST